jgi:hypothetical protein
MSVVAFNVTQFFPSLNHEIIIVVFPGYLLFPTLGLSYRGGNESQVARGDLDGWLDGVFGSSQSGAHLPDGGAGESATCFARINSQHRTGHIFYIPIFSCHWVWECLVLGEGHHIHPGGKHCISGRRISLLVSCIAFVCITHQTVIEQQDINF